jgi:tRNA (guanine37-N1)-methyltransferase
MVKEGKYMYIPVRDVPNELTTYKIVTKSFDVKVVKPHCYKDLLTLPKKRMDELPTSFDTIGAIILIKLPKTLFSYRKQIGKALLDTHKNIQTVCLVDPVAGELRTRNISIIAGEHRTQTTHIEHGLSFDVDVQTTYFSPRLASERKRVSDLVKPGETIVDMFAGVAPFAIMIARYAKPKLVYAIDINPDAIKLAQQNVKRNHILETVEVIYTDARDARKVIPVKADRIIMNLPFSAYMFFSVALSIAASKCILHYYDILKEEDIEGRISLLKKIASEHDYILADISIHKIKTYAPREFYIGLDITATKMPT